MSWKSRVHSDWRFITIIDDFGNEAGCYEVDETGRLKTKIRRQKRRKIHNLNKKNLFQNKSDMIHLTKIMNALNPMCYESDHSLNQKCNDQLVPPKEQPFTKDDEMCDLPEKSENDTYSNNQEIFTYFSDINEYFDEDSLFDFQDYEFILEFE